NRDRDSQDSHDSNGDAIEWLGGGLRSHDGSGERGVRGGERPKSRCRRAKRDVSLDGFLSVRLGQDSGELGVGTAFQNLKPKAYS
ncbi:hypothetical protein, partial [Chamaesiphon sp. VAR_69_metabat_338]|uniref:hypothetical protein n=1 Tax=Chamaesiphon sp. VAR_69_metabat_338 TaxID=2964704 RepID=UPI00286DBED1